MEKKKIIKVLLIAFGVIFGLLAVSSIISGMISDVKHKNMLKKDSLEYAGDTMAEAETFEELLAIKAEAAEELFTEKYDNELNIDNSEWLKKKLLNVNEESTNVYVELLGEYQYNLAKVWDYELEDYIGDYVEASVEILNREEYKNTTLKFYDSKGSVLEVYKHDDGKLYANVMLAFMDKETFGSEYYDYNINIVKPNKIVGGTFDDVIDVMKESGTVYYNIMTMAGLSDIKTSTEVIDKVEFYFMSDNSENESVLESGYDEVTWAAFTLGPREIQIVKYIYANVDSKVEELEFLRFLYERDITSYDILGSVESALYVYGAKLH